MPKTVSTAPLLDASAGSDKRIYSDANNRFVLEVRYRRCWKPTEVIPLEMLWRTKQWSLDSSIPKPLMDDKASRGMFRAYLQRPAMQVNPKTGLLSITSAPDDAERIKAGVETDHKLTTLQRQRPQTMSSVTAAAPNNRLASASDVSEGRLTAIDLCHLNCCSSHNRIRSKDRLKSQLPR